MTRRSGLILIAAAMLAATGLVVAASRDYTAPTVSWATPLAGGFDVDLDAAITVTFSEDIDPASIGVDSFRLSANGLPVKTNVSYDAWTRSVVGRNRRAAG